MLGFGVAQMMKQLDSVQRSGQSGDREVDSIAAESYEGLRAAIAIFKSTATRRPLPILNFEKQFLG
jgi:hypothetical protein